MGGGAAAAAAAPAASAAPTSATTWRSRSRRPTPARPREIAVPTKITCKTCSGTGAKPRLRARRTCPTCDGHGPRAVGTGLLLDRAHLPDLPGPRRGHLRPLPRMPRRRPRHRGAHAVGQHSRRHRGRHAHPPGRRGRGGAARRAGRRPLHLPVDQAARVLPARRRRHLLPRAGVDDHRRARRRVPGADHRRRQDAR